MGAGCYLCEMRYGTIPGHEAGDAVGACKQCSVFACLAHGYRNGSKPAYICGCCLPNLLTTAAIKQVGIGGGPSKPSPGGPSTGDTPSYTDPAIDITELADAIGNLQDDRWSWLNKDVEFLTRALAEPAAPELLRGFTNPNAARARELMAAAVAIAHQLRLPAHELLPPLQAVMGVFVNVGR